MTAIALLFLSGIILLAFEVIVPGAILGILGSLALLGGVVVAFSLHGLSGGLVAFAVAAVLIGGLLFFEFYILPRTRWGRAMFLTTSIGGTSQPAFEQSLIGLPATAVTPLTPSGFVLVNGRQYDAFSRSGSVASGEALRVVAVESFRVVVTKS